MPFPKDATAELRTRAEILQRRAQQGDRRALRRLRALPEFRSLLLSHLISVAPTVRRRHCLAVIAMELGFPSWTEAKRAFEGGSDTADFGALLCPPSCGGHVNLWYARHADAAAVREARGGYLLAYKRHHLVVDRLYIESLGLDPDDPDWKRIGFDWANPRDVAARSRLFAKLVARLPREAA